MDSKLVIGISLWIVMVLPAISQVDGLLTFSKADDAVFFANKTVQSDLANTLSREIRAEILNHEDLKPQKIGLVTTYLFEERFNSRKAHLTYLYSKDGEKNYFFNRIADPVVQGLLQAFQGTHINLLTPAEFATSEKVKESYEALGENLVLSEAFSETVNEMDLQPSGEDFSFIYAYGMHGESLKIANALASFAETAELDALLSVEISTIYSTKNISLGTIRLIMHGVKPTGRSGAKGLLMNVYSFSADKNYPLVTIKGGKLSNEKYQGLMPAANRIGKNYIQYIDDHIEELFPVN